MGRVSPDDGALERASQGAARTPHGPEGLRGGVSLPMKNRVKTERKATWVGSGPRVSPENDPVSLPKKLEADHGA